MSAELNVDGMNSLRPPTGGGHPRRIDDDTREAIRAIALARPGDLGEPGTRWSLTRLRRYLIRHRVVKAISMLTIMKFPTERAPTIR